METSEKKFRYTYVFKNLGVLYLIFLIMIIIISLVGREAVFFICDGVMIFGGLIFVAIYLNTSVNISETEITEKTVLGKKSLMWSEIDYISSRNSSLKLHNHDGDVVLAINPRLDGSTEIFDLIFSKRSDLFDAYKNTPILPNDTSNIVKTIFGFLLVALAVIGYFRETNVANYMSAFILGLFFCLQATLYWFYHPRSIALENNSLVLSYLRKSVSISADDVVSVQIGKTKQRQVTSVFLVSSSKEIMEISKYKQSPLIIYPVLKQWHERYAINNLARQLNRN